MSFSLFESFSLFFLCLCLAVSVSKLPCQGFHVGHVINNLLVFWYTHPFPRHCVMRACKLNQLFQNRRKHYTKTRLFQKASTSFHCKLSSDHFWPPLHHFGPVHRPLRPTMSKNTSWSAEQKTMGIHLFLTTFWEAKGPSLSSFLTWKTWGFADSSPLVLFRWVFSFQHFWFSVD